MGGSGFWNLAMSNVQGVEGGDGTRVSVQWTVMQLI
jgi:hypothetical protein